MILTAKGSPRRRRCQGGKCADPIWKADRSRKAAAANSRRWWAALERACEKHPSKAVAFKAGYRLGYARAYRAWKRHYAAQKAKAA